MGCSATNPEVLETRPKPPQSANSFSNSYKKNIDNNFDKQSKNSKITYNDTTNLNIEKINYKENPLNTNVQNDLIKQFNSNYKNNNGIQLITSTETKIISSQINSNVVITNTSNYYFICLSELNPFSNDINENKNFILLKSELNKLKEHLNNKITNFSLNLSQKIYDNYNFMIKLKSISKNKYEIFDINKIKNKNILIIFFDILSYNAINKIKEIKNYIIKNNKNILFLPIMNMFIKENENTESHKKNFLEISQLDDCYILSHPFNSNFIKLFQLDCITESKIIIINQEKEINYILNDNIQFFTIEILNFYTNNFLFNNNNSTNDFYTDTGKEKICKFLDSNDCKTLIEKFKHEYNFEILFKKIDNIKFPIENFFMYNHKDEKDFKTFFTKIKQIFSEFSKNFFFSFNIIKKLKGEMIEAFNYINNILIKHNFKTNSKNYELITITENFWGNIKSKKFLLNFKLSPQESKNFKKILDIFSLNLYNNPQFAKLKIGYCIIPETNVELNIKKIHCKKIKLFKKKSQQEEYEKNNKEITYSIKFNIIIIINPNYLINDFDAKNKIISICENLLKFNMKFIICIFSYNELDAQKLRFVNYEKFINYNENDFEIIFVNSSDINNYIYFNYYSEDITYKLLYVDIEKNKLINFIDIDKISLISLETYDINKSDDNQNIIEYWNSLQINDNQISENNKNFNYKKVKEKFFNLLNDNKDYLNELNKHKILTNLNFKIYYEKSLNFIKNNSFNEYNKNCFRFNINFEYLDTLKYKFKFSDFKTEIQRNERKFQNIFTYNFIELKTIEIIFNKEKVCKKCNEKIKSEGFYFCKDCKNYYICENCFDKEKINIEQIIDDDLFFNSFIMNKEELKNSIESLNSIVSNNNNKTNKIFLHEHSLIFSFNKIDNFNSIIIKDIFNKYKNKLKKRNVNLCSFCDGYIYNDSMFLNIVLSHIKINSNEKNIFICDECFDKKEFKKYFIEINDMKQNLFIMRVFYK